MEKIKQKVFYRVSMITLSSAFFMSIMFFYLYLFDAKPPIIFDDAELPVMQKQYKAWDVIQILPSWCRYTDAPVTIYYSIVDTMEYTMPKLEFVWSSKKNECFKKVPKGFITPKILPPWKYYLQFKLEYKVNMVATRIVWVRSEDFYIVK